MILGNVAPFSRSISRAIFLSSAGVEAEDHQALASVLRVEFLEMTHLLAAGRSAGPPDVEPDDLAAVVR